jgi:biotin operon repressor
MIDGLQYVRAFYTGMPIVHPNSPLRYEVKDPPCGGEMGALVVAPNDQGKRKKTQMLTLFCPFTLQAYQITSEAGEISRAKMTTVQTTIEGMKEPKLDTRVRAVPRERHDLSDDKIERLSKTIVDNWKMRCRLRLPFDLDVAALVLTKMGKSIPEDRPIVKLDAVGEVRKTGKDAGPELLKAVNPDSKPGRVLKFFMEQRRSITEGMAEFGSTRSSLQSSLYGVWKDNGIGYVLAADMVDIVLPAGCEDPFSAPAKAGQKQEKTVTEKKTRGKPLDELLLTKLPEKGKRREVALATYRGFVKIADVASKLECSENSVKSHLNDLHIKHGFGFEIDGDKAMLLTPKGWMPE